MERELVEEIATELEKTLDRASELPSPLLEAIGRAVESELRLHGKPHTEVGGE